MKKETINVTYLSPVMKVVIVEIRQVMCQSGVGGGINDMSIGEEETI